MRASCAIAQNPFEASIGSFVVTIATAMSARREAGGQPGQETEDEERAPNDLDDVDEWGAELRERDPDLR